MNFNEENQIESLLNLNNYNREQRLAIFSDRHNFISANAGSGKTTVLIRKYIYELMKNKIVDMNPESIVAITFTNKAASDMLKKAYETFEDLLRNMEVSLFA
jgi:ATP-dependent exoDNAse (exonuclease V) beta subunit